MRNDKAARVTRHREHEVALVKLYVALKPVLALLFPYSVGTVNMRYGGIPYTSLQNLEDEYYRFPRTPSSQTVSFPTGQKILQKSTHGKKAFSFVFRHIITPVTEEYRRAV